MSNLKLAGLYILAAISNWVRPLLKKAAAPLKVEGEAGQAMVEYALLIALIALVVIGILVLLGPAVGSVFSGITSSVAGPDCTPCGVNSYPTPLGG